MSTSNFEHPKYRLVNGERFERVPGSSPATLEEEEEAVRELGRYVESLLVTTMGFVPIAIPSDDGPNITILASNDWQASTKLLLIIQNASGSLLGIFSRSVCMEQGLSKGSMIPYVRRALDAGFGVVILRPNTNSIVRVEPGQTQSVKELIPGTESPEIHTLCVWENVISKAENATKIALLGYANGASLCKDIFLRETVNSDNNTAANRIHAIVTVGASHFVEDDDADDIKSALDRLTVDFEASPSPRGYRLLYRQGRLGCQCLSLGPPTGTKEITNDAFSLAVAIDPVFRFLQIAESAENPSEVFSQEFARVNGHNPKVAQASVNTAAVREDNPVPPPPPSNHLASDEPPKRTNIIRRFSTFMGFQKEEEKPDTSAMSNKLTVNDFDLLKIVGKGAFGKVMLVRKKKGVGAGKIYAMKVLKKSMIIEKNQMVHAKCERDILHEIKHPFIVRLRFAFQNEDKLYMVTDYYNGGTLFFHLRKAMCFSEQRARFYSAELLLALNHLHKQNIIYRDLKLENVLLDHLGHIALTDFGLSKQNIDATGGATTFCGTPDYVAPELLRGQKYGRAVDWWSFGVLLFEMIHGQTPFFDKNRKVMFNKIVTTDVVIPSNFSPDTNNLIRVLLNRNPAKRLGSSERGTEDIKRHPFFQNIDFDELENKRVTPPFQPDVANEYDTKYVPKFFLDAKPADSVDLKAKKETNAATPFEAFTYTGEQPMVDTETA